MPRKESGIPGAYSQVQAEVMESHSIRRPLYGQLERELGSNILVVAFFTSFRWPAVLEDQDGDMIEEVLRNSETSGKHLVLVLNSGGGLALPAERIVNICRSYSDNGFTVVVPKMAKSAATMVCLGAGEIWLSPTSELGPIDPQIVVLDEKGQIVNYLGAHEVIESYNELMRQANRTKGRIEPYLQQLARFDARDIRSIRSAQQLSESIALKSLQTGMLSKFSEATIRKKIGPFLDPKYTKVHGRPIYWDISKKCGLKVKLFDLKSPQWKIIWQLYIRLNYFVTHRATKVIESCKESYQVPHQQGE